MALDKPEIDEVNDDHLELVNEDNPKKCYHCRWIDRDMIPVKLSYAFYFSAVGAWYPYIMLFLISLDLDPLMAGLILSIHAITSSLATPLWGFLTDFTGRKKIVLTTITIGLSATLFALPFVAVQLNDFTRNSSSLITQNNQTTTTNEKYCTTSCNDNRMFHGMLILFIMIGLFDHVINVFLDSNTMRAIELHPKKPSFGNQRVFGAITFGVGSVVAGALADSFNHPYMSNFSGVVFITVPLLVLGLPFYMLVIMQAEKNESSSMESESKTTDRKPTGSELAKLALKTCFKPFNFVFLFSNFIQGTSHVIMYNFVFLHMKEYTNSNDSILGLTIVASNIGEILIFPFSKCLIKRFGKKNCFLFSLLTNGIRFILLGYCTNPWLTLPIQLLHSFGFALFYSSMIELLTEISPKEICTTMFGINSSLSGSVASILGTLMGGWMYKSYKGTVLFVGLGVFCCGWSCIVFILFLFMSKRSQKDIEKDDQNNLELLEKENNIL